MQAMEISRSGLDVEWRRLEVIAENLANAGTSRTALGAAYQPQHLISGPRTEFGRLLDDTASPTPIDPARFRGVEVYGVEPDAAPPRMVHDPSNPEADANGFVAYPSVDQAAEMVLMIKTARVYESNMVAMTYAQQMYSKAAALGGRT